MVFADLRRLFRNRTDNIKHDFTRRGPTLSFVVYEPPTRLILKLYIVRQLQAIAEFTTYAFFLATFFKTLKNCFLVGVFDVDDFVAIGLSIPGSNCDRKRLDLQQDVMCIFKCVFYVTLLKVVIRGFLESN